MARMTAPASTSIPFVIGDTFSEELKAAGLDTSLPFGWNRETGELVDLGNVLTAEQRAIFDQVLAAHDPTKPLLPASEPHRFA
jgi:hypothetical protein